jgi:hypothetical protein
MAYPLLRVAVQVKSGGRFSCEHGGLYHRCFHDRRVVKESLAPRWSKEKNLKSTVCYVAQCPVHQGGGACPKRENETKEVTVYELAHDICAVHPCNPIHLSYKN